MTLLNPKRPLPAFIWPVRAYYEDTDASGVVYHAVYLKYYERARTEWLRAMGFSQHNMRERLDVVFTVANLEVDYLRPARLDDELQITCEPQSEGAASLRFAQRIYRSAHAAGRAPDLLLEANVRVACVDVRTMRPQRLPEFLADAVAAEAAGSG